MLVLYFPFVVSSARAIPANPTPTVVREMHQWSHTCVQIQVFPEGHLRSRLVFWHQGRRRRCWCLSLRPASLRLRVNVSVSLHAGRSDCLMLTHTTHTCRQVHLGAEASVARCQRGRCKDPRHPSLGHNPRAGGSLYTYIHVHTYTSIYLSIYLYIYIYCMVCILVYTSKWRLVS